MERFGKHRRVLVLGEDTKSFLAVIRSLARAGLEVHAAWCSRGAPALRSRCVAHVHALPAYVPGQAAALLALKQLLAEVAFDLIVPCADEPIFPLQQRRSEFAAFPIMLVPPSAFAVFSDKHSTIELARSVGVPTAQQEVANTIGEAEHCGARWGYPIVLKPRSSFAAGDVRRQRVFKVWNVVELRERARDMLAKGNILVAQHVPGVGEGIEFICAHGELLTAFHHRRVHEPIHGGGSSYRVSIPLDANMLSGVRRMVKTVGYDGVGMAEFKRNLTTNQWILVEVNARFWGSLALSVAAGMDFPRYAYEYHVLGRRDFPTAYRVGVFARHWVSDYYWLRQNFRADRANPNLHTKPLGAVALELLRIPSLKEVNDTFSWDDLGPGFAELESVIAPEIRTRIRKLRAVRRLMQRRARARLKSAQVIVVICKGNICRSPFAEQLLRRRFPGRTVSSAGTLPLPGRPCPADACAAAVDYEIDLSAHRSKVVTAELMREADAVFVFDGDNETALRSAFPEARDKLFLVGALNSAFPLHVPDPYGQPIETFRSCFAQLAGLLKST